MRYEATTHSEYEVFDNQEDRFLTVEDAIQELNDLDNARYEAVENLSKTQKFCQQLIEDIDALHEAKEKIKFELVTLLQENAELIASNRKLQKDIWDLGRAITSQESSRIDITNMKISRRNEKKWRKPFAPPLDWHRF